MLQCDTYSSGVSVTLQFQSIQHIGCFLLSSMDAERSHELILWHKAASFMTIQNQNTTLSTYHTQQQPSTIHSQHKMRPTAAVG